jgi:hypothetical protein
MASIGSPFDPFQGRSVARDPVQRLARRWEATQQKSNAAQDEATAVVACDEIATAVAEIFALPQSGHALVALKLRVLATWLAADGGEYRDGVRTDPLDSDEEMLASALADLERLARGTP